MTYISYIASFIAIILGLIEPFGKNMKVVLSFNFAGNVLVGLSYLLTGQITGAAICGVACIQVIINYIFNAKGKKVPIWLIIMYAIAFLAVNLLTCSHWYDAFALVAALLFVVSVAQSNAKHYRLLYFSNSTVWIFYDVLGKVYGNLLTHIVLFIATLISIYKKQKD